MDPCNDLLGLLRSGVHDPASSAVLKYDSRWMGGAKWRIINNFKTVEYGSISELYNYLAVLADVKPTLNKLKAVMYKQKE